MKKSGFYIIKDKFFEDMDDPFLKRKMRLFLKSKKWYNSADKISEL